MAGSATHVAVDERNRYQDDEGELTDEVRQEIEEAEQETARGEYVTHEEVMANYG